MHEEGGQQSAQEMEEKQVNPPQLLGEIDMKEKEEGRKREPENLSTTISNSKQKLK